MFNWLKKHGTPSSRREAFDQVLLLGAITILPIVFSLLADLPQAGENLLKIFLTGQLYLYAVSICGSIFWNTMHGVSRKDIIRRSWYQFFVVYCVAVAAQYIAITKDGSPAGLYHGVLSVATFVVALILWYLSILIARDPPPSAEDSNRKAVEEVAQEVVVKYD